MTSSNLSTRPARRFAVAAGLLTAAASPWLLALVRFALDSELYSHALLIPFVSGWLVWNRRTSLPAVESADILGAAFAALAGIAALVYALAFPPPAELEPHHVLTWTLVAYLLLLIAAGFAFLGRRMMWATSVPAAFLFFLVPLPAWAEVGIETALQRASAEAAQMFYSASGLPFIRDGQVFQLPGISLEIARECSGIHSSLVLFITSIVAGQLLLPAGWRRWTLTLFVIPLAIIRNGFRVWVLGELCVRIGPYMIDHWIHHHGGPIFFAISLIPFFLLLVLLHRIGRNRDDIAAGSTASRPSATGATARANRTPE